MPTCVFFLFYQYVSITCLDYEFIFAPFPFPQFTPFQVLDVRHVEKIKSMVVIKRLEKSNSLMKIKATYSFFLQTLRAPSSFSHNLTTADLPLTVASLPPNAAASLPLTAAALPPSTSVKLFYSPLSPLQSVFLIYSCKSNGCKK